MVKYKVTPCHEKAGVTRTAIIGLLSTRTIVNKLTNIPVLMVPTEHLLSLVSREYYLQVPFLPELADSWSWWQSPWEQ